LFEFPIASIDFSGITGDLTKMRASAQANGVYYGPIGSFGYFVDFQSDNTVDVYSVTNTQEYWAFSSSENIHRERNDVRGGSYIATHSINSECPVLFFDDDIWLQGDISSKVAIAADHPSPTGSANIVIHNNVDYVAGTNAGLLAIARTDVDIGIDVPNDMIANGIYIAQEGRFGRNRYYESGTYALPWNLRQYNLRDSLTRSGSVISRGRGGTSWSSGNNPPVSGFESRFITFDRDQIDDPPPLTPITNAEYELQDWRQEG
jgi:hypothetical protein